MNFGENIQILEMCGKENPDIINFDTNKRKHEKYGGNYEGKVQDMGNRRI